MLRWSMMVMAIAACGRIDFERCPSACGTGVPASACTADRDCASGHCVDAVCCDSACSGTCNSCVTGTCAATPAACHGDCASCEASADGFSCAPVAAACAPACSSAVCAGSGTTFSCDSTSCCSTVGAPNLAGSCSTGPTALLGDGCNFEYDYNSWVMASNFIELDWDVEQCQHGTWVSVDSGADAVPCTGCNHDTRNNWSDTCGNTTATTNICP